MSKTITITLDKKSINRAIQILERYKNSLDRKCEKLVQKLTEHGFDVAATRLYDFISDNKNQINKSGSIDAHINYMIEGKEGLIIASGKDAVFIEFGAGIEVGNAHPMASELGYHYGKGEFSKLHWLISVQDWVWGWYYKGRFYKGWEAAEYMYAALGELDYDHVIDIAKQVFK